ncbi:MAG: (Fe-S)-binding protein [Bryobacteraceae bacterium]
MPRRVSIFVTCVIDQLFPAVGLAMADVLERVGCEIDFREAQTCCGQPAFNSGFRDEAASVAKHFETVFADAETIVVPSGSCASMIGHHYAELLGQPESPFHGRIFEFSQFLTDELGIVDVGAKLSTVATYHDSCHSLRELHIKSGPRRLLAHVDGLELREMTSAEECCGFGGTFSVKFANVSGAMARTKIDAISKTGADTLISADASCLMQMRGAISRAGSPVRTMHLAEVLASR